MAALIPTYDSPTVSPDFDNASTFRLDTPESPIGQEYRNQNVIGNSDAGETGREMGQGMLRLADAAQKIYDNQVQAAIDIKEAELSRLDYEWTRQNAERKGQDAFGMTEEFVAAYGKRASELGEELPEQYRGDFMKRHQERAYGRGQTISRYEQAQKSAFEKAANAARLGAEMNRLNQMDPMDLNLSKGMDEVADLVRTQMAKEGIHDPETVDWNVAKVQGEIIYNQVQNLARTEPERAWAYFNANKDKIVDQDKRQQIESVVEKAAQMDRVEKAVEARALDPNNLATLRSWASKTYSGEEEDHAIKIVDRLTRNRAEEAAENIAIKIEAARKIYDSTGDLTKIPAADASFLKVYAPEKWKALENFASKTNVQTDYGVYDKLYADSYQRPDDFNRIDLHDYRDRISPSDLSKLMELQKKGRTDGGGLNEEKQLNNLFDTQGWVGSDKAKKRGAFRAAYYDEIAKWKQGHAGKEPLYDERQRIMDGLLMEGEVLTGSVLSNDPDMSYFEAAYRGGKSLENWVPFVPDDHKAAITKALTERGTTPTDELIQRWYKAMMLTGQPPK